MSHHVEKSRHGLYYLRLPQRLANYNNGKRIPLKTHSKRLAISRARHHIQAIDLCMSLSVSTSNPPTSSEYDILKESLERDFEEENVKLDLILQKAAPLPDSSASVRLVVERRLRNVLVEEAMMYISHQLEGAILTPGVTPQHQIEILNSLLNFAANLELDLSSTRQADGRLSRSGIEGARNTFRAEIYAQHEVLAERLNQSPSHQHQREAKTTADIPRLTLYELHALEQSNAEEMQGASTPATLQEYERYARVLTIMNGRQPIQDFTKDTFDQLHKNTKRIKLGTIRNARLETSSIEDLIPGDTKNYVTIKSETASSYSVRLAALHKFAFKRGFTTVHPELIEIPSFDKISTRLQRATPLDDTKSNSYQTHQLQAIFDGYLYRPIPLAPRREAHLFHFWFPLIALYTGMRINEISGLTSVAVAESREGIWHFKIEEDTVNNRRVKTIASKRRVPVHDHLIQLGFIKYVLSRKREKSVMLFDGLHYNKRNGWGNTATRFFTRLPSDTSPGKGYFWRVGVHVQAHDGGDFHAFRHTLIDKLRACGVDNDYDIEAITGHEKEDVSEADRYGDGPSLTVKAEKLNRVVYDELDLSHIDFETFRTYYKATILRSVRASEKQQAKQQAKQLKQNV